jgi:hypothetical protein
LDGTGGGLLATVGLETLVLVGAGGGLVDTVGGLVGAYDCLVGAYG